MALKAADLRSKTKQELVEELQKQKRELVVLRFQKAVSNLEKTHKFKETKLNIARINTVLTALDKVGA